LTGVTAIDVAEAELMVNEAVPLTDPRVAVMMALPLATARARPIVGAVLLTVAAPVLEEDQLTLVVKFCVELSL